MDIYQTFLDYIEGMDVLKESKSQLDLFVRKIKHIYKYIKKRIVTFTRRRSGPDKDVGI